jgi:hypothetical protein
MHVNMIYDPCFEVTSRKKQVVCGANPIKHDNGFALMLVQPLPPQRSVTAAPQPWLIEVAHGSVCNAATGTMSVISDEPVRYPCSASASEQSLTPRVYCGLLGTLHRAKVWTADKVCFTVAPSDGGPPFKLLKRVHRLWVMNPRISVRRSLTSAAYSLAAARNDHADPSTYLTGAPQGPQDRRRQAPQPKRSSICLP